MFQCIANCWRGWAQCSNAIVTDLAFNVYRAPALPPVGRWEKGAPVLPEERARTKPSAPFSGHCVSACLPAIKR